MGDDGYEWSVLFPNFSNGTSISLWHKVNGDSSFVGNGSTFSWPFLTSYFESFEKVVLPTTLNDSEEILLIH